MNQQVRQDQATAMQIDESSNQNKGLRYNPSPEQDELHTSRTISRCKCQNLFQSKRNKIIAGVLIGMIVIAAIVIPIAVKFGVKPQYPDVDTYFIDYKGKSIPISSTIVASEGLDYTNLQMTGYKVEASHPFLQVTLKVVKSDDPNKRVYEVSAPVHTVLDSTGWGSVGFDSNPQWLKEYNAQPRLFLDNFIKSVRNLITTRTEEGQVQFVIASIEEQTLIDIKYLPDQKKFAFILLEQDNTPDQPLVKAQENRKEETLKQGWLEQLQKKAAKKLRDALVSNLNSIKSNSENIRKQQQQFVQEKTLDQDWSKALINECKNINILEFRCSLRGLEALIDGFKAGDIKSIPQNAILTYSFKIILEEILA